MKAALIALVLAAVAPAHVRVTVLGCPLQVPAWWLIVAAEVLVTAVTAWLVVRALRRFRSTPWPRPAAGGAW